MLFWTFVNHWIILSQFNNKNSFTWEFLPVKENWELINNKIANNIFTFLSTPDSNFLYLQLRSLVSCHIKLSHRNPLEIPLSFAHSLCFSLICLFFPVPLPSPLSLQFPMVSHSTLKVTWVPGAVDVPAHRIIYSTNHGSDVKQVSRSQKSLVRFLMFYPNRFESFFFVMF